MSIGDSLPIIVGETGWKAARPTLQRRLEEYAALPLNAKWDFDLLYGNPGDVSCAWQGSVGGMPLIFFFQAFDEQWKGTDDGWGLWDISRQARYALCGTPAGPACKSDVYEGAGFSPAAVRTITFDSPDVYYTLSGFAGAEDSQVRDRPGGRLQQGGRVNDRQSPPYLCRDRRRHVGPTVGTSVRRSTIRG